MNSLRQHGIQTSIHYPAFHSFAAYAKYIQKGDLSIRHNNEKRANLAASSENEKM